MFYLEECVTELLRDPQLGQKKAAGGSDGLDGKDGVKIISDIEGFLEKEKFSYFHWRMRFKLQVAFL